MRARRMFSILNGLHLDWAFGIVAFACSLRWRPLGSFSEICSFRFDDAGMVEMYCTTDDTHVAQQLCVVQNVCTEMTTNDDG